MITSEIGAIPQAQVKPLKCVVWDLDGTLWEGTLAEDRSVTLREGVVDIIRALDARGVLNSIASRNAPEDGTRQLRAFGIDAYFLAPQINWGSKVASLQRIAQTLSIGLDSFAFVDDDPVERAEVAAVLPEVRTLAAGEEHRLLAGDVGLVGAVTEESRFRREMYLADSRRRTDETSFCGSREAFLAGLGMRFTVAAARPEDLPRAAELTVRTNQLNATGRAYSIDELDSLCRSPDHDLLIAELSDRYGSYGKIGLALIERTPDIWSLRMLLMSCRVISRGVGSLLLAHAISRARRAGVRLQADFIDTGRNRALLIAYRFAGLRELRREGATIVLEADPTHRVVIPDYIYVDAPE